MTGVFTYHQSNYVALGTGLGGYCGTLLEKNFVDCSIITEFLKISSCVPLTSMVRLHKFFLN